MKYPGSDTYSAELADVASLNDELSMDEKIIEEEKIIRNKRCYPIECIAPVIPDISGIVVLPPQAGQVSHK